MSTSGDRLSWKEIRFYLAADRARLTAVLNGQGGRETAGLLIFHPSYLCVLLYRISNYLYRSGHHLAARFTWQMNFMLTGSDISAGANLGPGLLVLSPAGIAVQGGAGCNLTLMPCSGIGGETGRVDDVGAGPGLPMLGDDVLIEPHGGVLGPVRIGNRVTIRGGLCVLRDVPDDAIVEGPALRIRRRGNAE